MKPETILKIIISIVGVWLLAAMLGGAAGIFNQPGLPPKWVGLFVMGPIIGFSLTYIFSQKVRQGINLIPLSAIAIANVWRFVGLGFVIGAVHNVLPPQFGYPEGLGDILAAAIAIPLAVLIYKGYRTQKLTLAFKAWNIFGLVDLISAITLGVLYSPSAFGILATTTTTYALTIFPVNLIPTFFVPLFILLHMLGLARANELKPKA